VRARNLRAMSLIRRRWSGSCQMMSPEYIEGMFRQVCASSYMLSLSRRHYQDSLLGSIRYWLMSSQPKIRDSIFIYPFLYGQG
jgi:hypothetical protein